jgi:prepilin-type N-terminal cleavage/methylation domain-containing protein
VPIQVHLQPTGRRDKEVQLDTRHRGFTLVELLIVLVVMGILIALAIANYTAMQKRAWEASTKANMHTFQLSAEDYQIRNGSYATDASQVAALLPLSGSAFYNPVSRNPGAGQAWVDQATWTYPLATGSTRSGIVAYGDSAGGKYQIAGRGATADLALVFSSGQ